MSVPSNLSRFLNFFPPVGSHLSQLPAADDACRREWSSRQQVLSLQQDFGLEHHRVLSSEKRFNVLVAGRRWGKTTTAIFMLLCHAAGSPGQVCYYIGPTERQAKEMAWRMLKETVHPFLMRRLRESDLEVELVNGSIIKVHGPRSLRGMRLDYVVLDECAYMPAEFWPEVVRPMLADQEGHALLCSTPCGLNHFYDLYLESKSRPEWGAFHFQTGQGGYVSARELVLLRSTMDPMLYAQEIEASFELQQGRVYHAFSRDQNVSDIAMDPGRTLLVGMDFNCALMTAVVAQKVGEQCHVSREIVLPNSNTFEMMDELLRLYPNHRGVVHPDPTGSARKTSAAVGQTDHTIIQQKGWQVYPMKTYAIVDRINSVNAMFLNAKRERRLFIDRKCKNLIRALEGLTFKDGTNVPDKSAGFDHITDALGYLIMAVFPMVKSEVTSTKVTM